MRAVIFALVLIFFGATAVLAVKPHPLEEITRTELLAPLVEQQGNIQNMTGCAWDADDDVQVTWAGWLDDSFTSSECVIADFTNHLLAIQATVSRHGKKSAPPSITADIHIVRNDTRRELDVSSVDWQIIGDRLWILNICTFTPEYDNQDPTFDIVDDGVGWPTDVEFTVTNDSGKRIRAISMRTIISSDSNRDIARWCP